ncbi:tetratricopeptide repeat protein [Aureliella helgolandensis]|uniref:Tetratricopeptide repeat protein n=1 Tax=Aureliella helgolandensis TaxID=2527968 RepID=A0A518G1P1_9BACT|nr:tetratricopeptide repeat protein [Aureliella helgolandensis]QDV22512.1 Tetratricopeptide repeat protein [Aureliella helgolandensis]
MYRWSLAILAMSGIAIACAISWHQGRSANSVDGSLASPQHDTSEQRTERAAPTAMGEREGLTEPTIRIPQFSAPGNAEQFHIEAETVVLLLLKTVGRKHEAIHVAALLEAQLHNTEKAESLWRECIDLAPDTERYYVNLAAVLSEQGDSRSAVEILKLANQRGLRSVDLVHHLCVSYIDSGELKQATVECEKGLEEFGKSPALLLVYGSALLENGQADRAEQILKEAIRMGAGAQLANSYLMRALLLQGKREEASVVKDLLRESAEQEEHSADSRYAALSDAEGRRILLSVLAGAGHVYQLYRNYEFAELVLLRAISVDPGHAVALEQLATMFGQLEQYANELTVREHQLQLRPFDLLGHLKLAKAAALNGNPQRAEAAIKLAISRSPTSSTGFVAMAEFLLEQNEAKKAEWYATRAFGMRPSDELAAALLRKTLRLQGKETEAQEVHIIQD